MTAYPKTIAVPANILAHCFVKSERATDLSREEIMSLMSWCDCQHEDLWTGMSLQEILNVYRAFRPEFPLMLIP